MGQVCGLYQVDQSTVAVKEKFGKFSTVLSPGCHCVPWCCGVNVAGVLSLRIQQLDVRCETKSKVWCCFFSPPLPCPSTCLPAWIFYQWSCEDESELRGRKLWGLCVCDVQDNVFVTVVASVQYRAHIETAEDAFYKLTNPREQIKSYVFDGKYSSPCCKQLMYSVSDFNE